MKPITFEEIMQTLNDQSAMIKAIEQRQAATEYILTQTLAVLMQMQGENAKNILLDMQTHFAEKFSKMEEKLGPQKELFKLSERVFTSVNQSLPNDKTSTN